LQYPKKNLLKVISGNLIQAFYFVFQHSLFKNSWQSQPQGHGSPGLQAQFSPHLQFGHLQYGLLQLPSLITAFTPFRV